MKKFENKSKNKKGKSHRFFGVSPKIQRSSNLLFPLQARGLEGIKCILNICACFMGLPRLRLAMTFSTLAFVSILSITSESWAATTCAWEKDADGNDTTKLIVSGSGAMSGTSNCPSGWKDTATEIEIEKGVTWVSNYSFQDATKVTKVTIPNTVTGIGFNAFAGLSNVKSLVIPDSVTSIYSTAFDGMRGVTSLTIGNSVTSIGEAAFRNMSGVTGELKIPDSVTAIGTSAFSGLSNVTSLTLGDSISSIGWYAFDGMSGVTGSLVIPDSVTSIGWLAFNGMSGVTSVTIGDSVTSIGQSAFQGMRSVTSLTLGDSITSIGSWAFFNMNNLTSLIIPDNLDTTVWDANSLKQIPLNANIVCLGDMEKCKQNFANILPCKKTVDGVCVERNYSKLIPATEEQCTGKYVWTNGTCEQMGEEKCNATLNAKGKRKYYFNGKSCQSFPKDLNDITCVGGYAKLKGNCVDPLKTFAKKRYTPAEAAQWLNEDNNTITLTFKKQ